MMTSMSIDDEGELDRILGGAESLLRMTMHVYGTWRFLIVTWLHLNLTIVLIVLE